MKKITIITSSIILFTLVFTAPWIYILDNGEDVIESSFFNKPFSKLFTQARTPICTWDGVDMHVKWAPFGATVRSCSYSDYYYVSFWGQKFHINSK